MYWVSIRKNIPLKNDMLISLHFINETRRIKKKKCMVLQTWTLAFSSLKKLKMLSGCRGSQRDVAALTTVPLGCPSSELIRTEIRTPVLFTSDNWGKSNLPDMLSTPQKFFTILCDSFMMLLLPSREVNTEKQTNVFVRTWVWWKEENVFFITETNKS